MRSVLEAPSRSFAAAFFAAIAKPLAIAYGPLSAGRRSSPSRPDLDVWAQQR